MSRQNLHKKQKKRTEEIQLYQKLKEMVVEARKEHPRMSARRIHKMLSIKEIGINKFERFVSSEGLGIQVQRSFIKTTRSGIYNYPNLTHGLILDGINQLWASDITYFLTPESTYYITIIIDVYSRRILGYTASDNMMTINNLKALSMAFKVRKKSKFSSLIHHSDKGSQYGSTAYKTKLEKAEITISMAETSLENAYAERVIGIIKNEYLLHMGINNLEKLQKVLPIVIKRYNQQRPHSERGYLSPISFERKIFTKQEKEAMKMKLYDFRKEK